MWNDVADVGRDRKAAGRPLAAVVVIRPRIQVVRAGARRALITGVVLARSESG